MKKSAAIFFALATFGFLTLSATADTLTLEGTGGQSVGNDYIYPYNFSIDGSATSTALMCLDYTRDIVQGETWQVDISAVPTWSNQYKAEAIILSELEANPTDSDYQFAAWKIFDSAATPATNPGFTQAASDIASAALSEAANPKSGFNYSNFTLFAPITSTPAQGGSNGLPQEFLGNFPTNNIPNLVPGVTPYISPTPTPEPGSLLLLGTGAIAMSLFFRRRPVRA